MINYVAPNSRSVSPFPHADPREIRALQYFKAYTAPELAGSFSPELWNKFVLRLAYHQSSVHHAVVALGTVHEELTSTGCLEFSDYANREYCRAIREVVALNDAGTSDAIEIALATCVLFACLEGLRGHYKSSLSHLVAGLNVLEEDQRKAQPRQATCIPRKTLLSLFLRMDAQRMDLGGSSTTPGTMLSIIARPVIPSCFLSVEEARHQLELLYHHILQLFFRADEANLDRNLPRPPGFWNTLLEQKLALERVRQSWEDALDTMLGRGTGNELPTSENRDPGVLVLDVANRTIKILLYVDLIDPEIDFDKCEEIFDQIVCDADEYLLKTSATRPALRQSSSSSSSRNSSPHSSASMATSRTSPHITQTKILLPKPEAVSPPMFSLSLGCVSSLYLSASRCRNPRIRYRALDLLRKCNRREGLWDSNIAARIAENVINIEEAKAAQTLPGRGQAAIPESNRVKFVDVKFGAEGHGKAMYSFENPTRSLVLPGEMPSEMDTTGLGHLYEW